MRDIAFAVGYVLLVLLAVAAALLLYALLQQPSTGPAR
jgi:hypothetical protein